MVGTRSDRASAIAESASSRVASASALEGARATVSATMRRNRSSGAVSSARRSSGSCAMSIRIGSPLCVGSSGACGGSGLGAGAGARAGDSGEPDGTACASAIETPAISPSARAPAHTAGSRLSDIGKHTRNDPPPGRSAAPTPVSECRQELRARQEAGLVPGSPFLRCRDGQVLPSRSGARFLIWIIALGGNGTRTPNVYPGHVARNSDVPLAPSGAD